MCRIPGDDQTIHQSYGRPKSPVSGAAVHVSYTAHFEQSGEEVLRMRRWMLALPNNGSTGEEAVKEY